MYRMMANARYTNHMMDWFGMSVNTNYMVDGMRVEINLVMAGTKVDTNLVMAGMGG
jgi:hypothetical protein